MNAAPAPAGPAAAFLAPARRRFWLVSDLQQREPELARACMTAAVDDFLSLGLAVDAVCYLGDSTEGPDPAHLRAMADMQVGQLARVDAPVWFVTGNHEYDYHRNCGERGRVTIPMRERVLREARWHVPPTVRDWLLVADFGDLALALFSDHAAPDGSWFCVHGGASDGARRIPYPDPEAPARARAAIAALGKPVFTMSHYAFPGGNRASELMGELLPLPENVVAHFYGHCHVGDFRWGGKDCLRQVSGIDGSALSQFDVASLESRRGDAVRSAVLEWHGGASFGVFFRNHTARAWEKCHVELRRPGRGA
ncbi:MAG: metallophosphoesterase [Kiritimatiellae bacterium]|nr:metallophosphoesterase [Kiritimatiellia bacterium]